MSDDYWKNKNLYAKMNRTAVKEATAEQAKAKAATTSPPAPELITFATPQEEIAYLRALAHDIWKLYCDLALLTPPENEKPMRAFYAVDRKLRALGILPSTSKKK